jgi:exosome complex component MTR3
LYCDFKYAPFSRDNRKSHSENEEKMMSSSIKSALESVVCLHEFPNYQIDILVMALEDDGAVLSTAIMAAGVAFIDACIPCFDVPTASTIAFYNGAMLVDPTAAEEEEMVVHDENHGMVTITSLNSIDQVAQILFSGFIEPSVLKEAKKRLLEINKLHEKYLKKVISAKIVRENRES